MTFVVASIAHAQSTTIHVDITAPNGGDGEPLTPFNDLPYALTQTNPGDVAKVADGVYKPGTSQMSSFILRKVHIIGGYPGFDVQNGWAISNPDVFETVLSGLVNPNTGAKAYTVVKAFDDTMTPQNTSLSNVTIQDGYNNNNGHGGGIRVTDGANPRFHRCKIRQNVALLAGAGVYIKEAGGVFTRCVIENNEIPEPNPLYTTFGAGVAAVEESTLDMRNCVVRDNVLVKGVGGAGIAVRDANSTLLTVNCVIVENEVTHGNPSEPNSATGAGVCLFHFPDDYPYPPPPGPGAEIINTTVSANTGSHGSGLSCFQLTPPNASSTTVVYVKNSIIWGQYRA